MEVLKAFLVPFLVSH